MHWGNGKMYNPKYPPKVPLKTLFESDMSGLERGPSFLPYNAVGLENLGYISVSATIKSEEWPIIHQWCRDTFGNENYTWTGTIFWFDRIDFAEDFAIRWG